MATWSQRNIARADKHHKRVNSNAQSTTPLNTTSGLMKQREPKRPKNFDNNLSRAEQLTHFTRCNLVRPK